MKRGIILSLSFLILVSVIVTTFSQKSLTGNVVLEPSITPNCSESEIKNTWNSIFKESSEGITILSNNITVQNQCEKYLAYKISGPNQYILSSLVNSNNETKIYAYYGSFLDGFKNILKNFKSFNEINIINSDGSLSKNANFFVGNLYPRTTLLQMQYANTNFKVIFKAESSQWNQSELYNTKSFGFSENQSQLYISNLTGNINSNYTYAELIYYKKPLITSCIPSIIQQNTSCNSLEMFNITYSGNNCDEEIPENETSYCDFDANGIIGNISEIIGINTNISLEIDDKMFNFTKNYSGGNKEVEISDKSVKNVVKFDWDFSKPLNFKEIFIEKQDEESSFGYLIVNGINTSKTIKINQISDSDNICIKDEEVYSIEEISLGCEEENEYFISCPGKNSTYECKLSNNTFTVSGVKHSAVIEMEEYFEECTPDWLCGEWGECISGIQDRECIDRNTCGTLENIPETSKSCNIIATGCTPNWNCTSWKPEKCPQNGTQTRECTDLNNCGITTDLVQSCNYTQNDSFKLFLVIIVIVILIIFVIIGLILYFISQRNLIPYT